VIGRLEGVLREKQPTHVLVDVGGVGYEVWVPLSTFATLPDEGKVVSLRIHTHVREDALVLFGFASALEREVFERLLGASRVGPKLALTVLSGLEARPLVEAVRSGDVATLSSVPGIGRRMAERIVVELRDRMAELQLPGAPLAEPPGPDEPLDTSEREGLEQILSALLHLGVPRSQAERAARRSLEQLGRGVPIESLIRAALRGLSR
jgi:Holliday junction DNA helicase RuvA